MAEPAPSDPLFLPAGDTALVVQFGETVDRAINARVRQLDAAVRQARLAGVVETVPTFRSLMIHYDPMATSHGDLADRVRPLIGAAAAEEGARTTWHLPCCYEGAHAPDLAEVAGRLGLTPARVVELHAAVRFEVFMMGFLPGFAYLGTMPDSLVVPRRSEPRLKVPAGSVSIAMNQTTIYAIESPGGWNLIGRTPVRMFDLRRERPVLTDAGDRVVFEPIGAAEFDRLAAAAAAGELAVRGERSVP